MAVLDALSQAPLSPGEIAARIGEPRSTVYRLVANLRELKLVEPGVDPGTYRLGVKLLRLGEAVRSNMDERRIALPIMEEIHAACGETVFLCVRRGFEAVCIERIDGRLVQTLALRLGGALPLHVGAAPRVLLAFESEQLWERYFEAGPFTALTESTPATEDAIRPLLQAIRAEGFAVSDEDVTAGIAAIGAPIFDYTGDVCAALSVSGIRGEILGPQSRARELTVQGAARISALLGHQATDGEQAV